MHYSIMDEDMGRLRKCYKDKVGAGFVQEINGNKSKWE